MACRRGRACWRPAAGGAGALRPHRPRRYRRCLGARGVPGPEDGRGVRRSGPGDRDHRTFRFAWTRGRRFSHRVQVADGVCRGRRAQVRHLQRRRGRSRCIHGSRGAGKRSACSAGGNRHRRLCGRSAGGDHLLPRRIPFGAAAPAQGHRTGEKSRFLGTTGNESACALRYPDPRGSGRLCLRRGNRPHRLAGRPARHAPAQAAFSGAKRPVRLPDAYQQCGNLCQCAVDSPSRRRDVCRIWNEEFSRHQGICPGGQHPARRPGGSADGDHVGRDPFRAGRRCERTAPDQGGTDRRPFGGMPAEGTLSDPHRL